MSINVGQVSTSLSDGNRFYAYSGDIVGGVGLPASITLINIPNTGLKDSFVKIQPFYGRPLVTAVADALGLLITIDGVNVFTTNTGYQLGNISDDIELFIPRQSSFQILSLNTANNNTQVRGVNVLGWSL